MTDQKTMNRLHRISFGILILLVAQFVLGMALNLLISFPTYQNNTVQPDQYAALFAKEPVLLLHFLIGFGLLINSIIILIFSLKYEHKDIRIRLVGILGFLAVLGALLCGLLFVHGAFQDNSLSYYMSLGSLIALISYFTLFYVTKK